MLQSSGYFTNINCPYFASGFCERPHCHFKHVRKDSSSTVRTDVSTTIDSKADLLKIYSETLRKIQEAEKELLASSTSQAESPAFVTYIPTPKNVVPRRSSQESHIPAMCMPEYKPTPISQLRRMHKDSCFGDSVDYSPAVSSYKRKINELYPGYSSPQSGKVSKRVEEYDPTKVPPTAICKYSSAHSSGSGSGDDEPESHANLHFSDSGDESSSKTSVVLRTEKSVEEQSRAVCTLDVDISETQFDSKFDVVTQILQDSKSSEVFIKSWKVGDSKNSKPSELEISKPSVKKAVEQDFSEKVKTAGKKPRLEQVDDETTKDSEENQKSLKRSRIDEVLNMSAINNKPDTTRENEENVIKTKAGNTNTNNNLLLVQNQCQGLEQNEEKILKEKSLNKTCSSVSKNDKIHLKSNGISASAVALNESDKNGIESDDKSRTKSDIKSVEVEGGVVEGVNSSKLAKSDKTLEDGALKSPSKKSSSHKSSSSHSSHKSSSSHSSHKSSSKSSSSGKSSSKNTSSSLSKASSHKSSSSNRKSSSSKSSSEKPSSSASDKSTKHTEKKSSDSKKSSSSKSSSKLPSKTSSKSSSSKTSSSKSSSSSKHSSSTSKKSVDKDNKSGDHKSVKSKSHKSSKDLKHSSTKSSNKSKEKSTKNEVSESCQSTLNGNHSEDQPNTGDFLRALSAEDSKWFENLEADLDNHDELEECWKIFNEESAVVNPQVDLIGLKPKSVRLLEEQTTTTNNSQETASGRRRVAHNPSLIALTEMSFHKAPPMRKSFTSPAQAMANRFQKLQEAYLRQSEQLSKSSHNPFTGVLPKQRGEHRVAHVPNAARLAAMSPPRRNSLTQQTSSATQYSTAGNHVTVAATVCKGERRIAHSPIVAQSKRPVIPASYGNKVALNVRQRYLNLFIDECLKFASSEEAAYAKGLEEESAAYERSSNKTVYLNVVVNILKRLRTEAEAGPSSPPPSPPTSAVVDTPLNSTPPKQQTRQQQLVQRRPTSHQAMLGGAKAARTSFSIQRNRIKPQPEENIKGALLYKLLLKYMMTQEQLVENGFPQPNPAAPGRAKIKGIDIKKNYNTNSSHRQCSRCQSFYVVDEDGFDIRREECIYHWGNIWKKRIAGCLESRYSCCEGDAESDGCTVGEGHVMETVDLEKVTGFVQTLEKPVFDGDFGVYALDCEMCYTTQGIELTRITVIGDSLKPVYETMVKPENPVLDHNTRFSGITKEDLLDVHTTLRDVQAVLLSLFSQKTILIGHSLESDFKALRLIHNTVVDTTVVFPHRRGPPFKRALRTLMAEHLNKIIQNSEGGHDSQEDAVACLELMLWKIKEDLKCSR